MKKAVFADVKNHLSLLLNPGILNLKQKLVNLYFSFLSSFFFFLLFSSFFFSSCTKDRIPPSFNGYPEEVGQIFLNTCATPGCHNDKSYEAAAGLNLSSWENLFKGTNTGAAIIPYSPEQSPLMFFINTFSDLGPQLEPAMPLNSAPLSRAQVILVRDWIASGAGDKDGIARFPDRKDRKKFYVANQECDLVTVFDAETKLAMRCIKVGLSGAQESPHMIKVSPDGRYWYVCFLNGTVLQKFRTLDDSPAGNIEIGPGYWNTFAISADSKKAFVVSWEADGKVAVVNLETMALETKYEGSGFIKNPHGSAVAGNVLYLTAQTGNFVYRIPVNDPGNYEEIILEPSGPVVYGSKFDAHEIIFSPDGTKYFVTCQKSHEVRIMDSSNDSWLATIPNIYFPQEMSISSSAGYLFVSSPDDTLSFPGQRGSVSVINYKNNTFEKKIFTGFQPHGIAVDEDKQLVYVANRNANPAGPAPHHTSGCGGRNGYITIIDMKTLELMPGYRAEVSPDPYSVAVKN